jgi:hypothetical protein
MMCCLQSKIDVLRRIQLGFVCCLWSYCYSYTKLAQTLHETKRFQLGDVHTSGRVLAISLNTVTLPF